MFAISIKSPIKIQIFEPSQCFLEHVQSQKLLDKYKHLQKIYTIAVLCSYDSLLSSSCSLFKKTH